MTPQQLQTKVDAARSVADYVRLTVEEANEIARKWQHAEESLSRIAFAFKMHDELVAEMNRISKDAVYNVSKDAVS